MGRSAFLAFQFVIINFWFPISLLKLLVMVAASVYALLVLDEITSNKGHSVLLITVNIEWRLNCFLTMDQAKRQLISGERSGRNMCRSAIFIQVATDLSLRPPIASIDMICRMYDYLGSKISRNASLKYQATSHVSLNIDRREWPRAGYRNQQTTIRQRRA